MEKRISVGERALAQVEEHYPHLRIERKPGWIIASNDSEGGFEVSISDEGSEAIVWGGGSYVTSMKHLRQQRLSCGSSKTQLRIVLSYRGKHLSRWRQERFENGNWVTVSRGRPLLPLPFWWKESEEILQNRLIERSPPEAETS